MRLGPNADVVFGSVTLKNLTALRPVASDSDKTLVSTDFASWVAGTTNQVIVTDNGDGSITLSLPQDIHTGATNFSVAGGSFTGVFSGISPTANAHLATKEYVDLAVGTFIDLFLSDTASGIGSNYFMYSTDTVEGESTIVSAALGQGDDQLIFEYITEAGSPGVTQLRTGVYDGHLHLNRGVGDKPTTIYWTLSKVDADGTSNETLVSTSETSEEIATSGTEYSLHATLSAAVPMTTTNRIIVKVYANVGASGGDSEVTIAMEGTTDSHISIKAPGVASGQMTYVSLKATTQSEGDLHLSNASWGVSKALINSIRVVTSSTNWDLYILQNDNGFAVDDAAIPKYMVARGINGNANLKIDLPYEDEDASSEVHLYYLDNSGANTADIYIIGTELA